MLITTFSPSVLTHVWVSWGEPFGISVATKHGLGLRNRSSRPSGRGTAPGSPSVGESIMSVAESSIESMFEELLEMPPDADEAALIARVAELEKLKYAAAAGQARLTVAFAAARAAREEAAGMAKARRGGGMASEIALARRDSPNQGGRHLGFATALGVEMPHTLAALGSGVLSEWRATLIVRESACLTVEDRRTLDAELCGDPATLDGWGDARIAAEAKKIAYRLDPHAVLER